jgi:hypothetical protein
VCGFLFHALPCGKAQTYKPTFFTPQPSTLWDSSGLITSCSDQYGVISGTFRLRDDSPLPSWFTLPLGMTRDQVSVSITDYEETTPGWKVRFVVRDKHRWMFNKIQEQMGHGYWHPDSLRQNPPGGSYPNWIIIAVKGTKEVYEQSEHDHRDLLKIVKKPLE